MREFKPSIDDVLRRLPTPKLTDDVLKLDEFWLRSDWPADFEGKVFVARALIRFAETQFENWLFEDFQAARTFANQAAYGGLSLARSPSPLDIARAMATTDGKRLGSEELTIVLGRLLQQFSEAQDRLAASFARSDGVKTFVRAKQGGAFHECPFELWITESYPARFARGEVDPGDPFGQNVTGPDHCYLYVDVSMFELLIGGDAPASDKSGGAGRPSSMHLVEDEMRRRAASGEMLGSLNNEAEHLSQWLSLTHRNSAPAKPGTIKNSLRATYRALKGA